MATKKLIIHSADNEDWNGTWLKGEVEKEMMELDVVPEGNDWISWILGHVFDCRDYSAQIEEFIIGCDSLVKATFMFDNGEVTVKKI